MLRLFDLDQRTADVFFDHAAGAFRWHDAWWANELLHTGGRDAIAAIGLLALVAVALGLATGIARPAFRAWVRPASYLALCLTLGTGIVSVLKHSTYLDCPWDMEPWGGSRPYRSLFDTRPAGQPASGCFPGGHSSGGFALVALYFLARDRHRSRARIALAVGLTVGATFALGQWARGAHFPSHDLWSAAICWTVALALYVGVYRRRVWSRP